VAIWRGLAPSATRTFFTAAARHCERVMSQDWPPQRAVVPVSSIRADGLADRYWAISFRAFSAALWSRKTAVLGSNPTGPLSGKV
jgi:hypothetical protein